jgi:hypothetical protein
MEGFKGYQCKVKIGNWSEDMELEAVRFAAIPMLQTCFPSVGTYDLAPARKLISLMLAQAMLKDYLLKKERGQLKCTQAEQRFAHALRPTALAPK